MVIAKVDNHIQNSSQAFALSLPKKTLNQMPQQACIELIEENGGIENVAVNEIPFDDDLGGFNS